MLLAPCNGCLGWVGVVFLGVVEKIWYAEAVPEMALLGLGVATSTKLNGVEMWEPRKKPLPTGGALCVLGKPLLTSGGVKTPTKGTRGTQVTGAAASRTYSGGHCTSSGTKAEDLCTVKPDSITSCMCQSCILLSPRK